MEQEGRGRGARCAKVLFIGGWGRSGSTLLGNILGQIEGFVHIGEARYIWDRGLVENRRCGCGVPFAACDFWRRTLDEAFEDRLRVDPHRLLALRERVRTRHLALALCSGRERRLASRMEEYPLVLGRLYQAIRKTAGSRVIVDSSKFPAHAWALQMMSAFDLYVVHLVRDPRGVAYSWRRKKPRLDLAEGEYVERHGLVDSALHWVEWNMALEALGRRLPGRYAMLRYEDFAARPQEALERLLDLLQERAPLPFVNGREARLEVTHTVSGNPDRFRTGVVAVQVDDEWVERMRMKDKFLVTLLTWPLLVKYGYAAGRDGRDRAGVGQDIAWDPGGGRL